jgi:DNA polymerase-3 subunit beta
VSTLPNDRITLTLNEKTQSVCLTCGRFESTIKGIAADEFPPVPSGADGQDVLTLPPDVLRQVITQVAFAAATDESRPVLTGVLVRLQGDQVIFAAADGFRLAKKTLTTEQVREETKEAIVPARTLSELARTLADVDGDVTMSLTATGMQVLFTTESVSLVSRLIDGKFPDFERIIPAEYQTRTVMERKDLEKAVRLASFFAAASQNIVKLAILPPGDDETPGCVEISANAAEVGDNRGSVDGIVNGEGGPIALNVKYLGEFLGAIKSVQVALETQTPQSPGVFKPVGDETYTHVIMPMSLR